MVHGDELLYVDMTTSGSGDPIRDLASICSVLHVYREILTEEEYFAKYGLSRESAAGIWETFLSYYYEGESEETIRNAEKWADGVAAIRILCGGVVLRSSYSERVLNAAGKIVLDSSQALQKLPCFRTQPS